MAGATVPAINASGSLLWRGAGALELILDRHERGVEAAAEQAQRSHDHDRYQGGDQAVLDGGGAGLVGQQLAEEEQGLSPVTRNSIDPDRRRKTLLIP